MENTLKDILKACDNAIMDGCYSSSDRDACTVYYQALEAIKKLAANQKKDIQRQKDISLS